MLIPKQTPKATDALCSDGILPHSDVFYIWIHFRRMIDRKSVTKVPSDDVTPALIAKHPEEPCSIDLPMYDLSKGVIKRLKYLSGTVSSSSNARQ